MVIPGKGDFLPVFYLENQGKKVSYSKKRQQCQALLGCGPKSGDLKITLGGSEEQMEREEVVSSQDASRKVWRKKSEIRNWGHRVEVTLKHGFPGCVSSTPGGRAGREKNASKKMNVLPLHARQHSHTQCQVSPDT